MSVIELINYLNKIYNKNLQVYIYCDGEIKDISMVDELIDRIDINIKE